jgi:hypothetical protein
MAEMCQLSRSRFYDLIEAGVFPKPILHPSSKRPMFDRQLQQKCLEVRRTGIGANGVRVLFNRKPRRSSPVKAQRTPAAAAREDHGDLVDSLKALGMQTTNEVVAGALAALFPLGHGSIDAGDLVRKVFPHLQAKRK